MCPWPELDLSVCAVCGGAGIVPLTDVPGRTDFAVCDCATGQQWRYAKQTDQKRRTHAVNPIWHTWASEHSIPLREAVLDIRMQLEQARAALRQVEWVAVDDGVRGVCLWCDRSAREGHAPDCTRQAALKEYKHERA